MNLLLLIGSIWLLLAIMIGMAAESADRSGLGWFTITLIFGIFGLLAYLATSPSKKEKELEQRVSELERGGNYCQTCGSELEDGRCPECDGEVERQTHNQQEDEQAPTVEDTGSPFTKLIAYSVAVVPLAAVSFILSSHIFRNIFTATPPGEPYYTYSGMILLATLFTLALTTRAILLVRSLAEEADVTPTEKATVMVVLITLALLSLYQVRITHSFSQFQLLTAISLAVVTLVMPATVFLEKLLTEVTTPSTS